MTETARPGIRVTLPVAFAAAVLMLVLLAPSAHAQVFGPPSTFFGSVTDSAGPVAEGLPVEAYVGDKLCGSRGKTEYVGEGEGRVAAYSVDVVSKEQTEGCGAEGVEVRIKIGGQFVNQTGRWKAGPVEVDASLGTASPVALPTATKAPTRAPSTPKAEGTPTLNAQGTPVNAQGTPVAASAGTIPAGSPGAGSPVPTLAGGLSTTQPGVAASASDDGGFPVWGVVAIVLVGVTAVGGGAGLVMARNRRAAQGGPLE
ncbi:MAG: hypothetical protein HYX53_00485 [Chloroflexi bacterium]|nr:hypothetical protein [Chloroflexota bacterium]